MSRKVILNNSLKSNKSETMGEKPATSETWEKVLKFIKDNLTVSVAIFFAYMYWDERKDNRSKDEKRDQAKEFIIKAQGDIIQGYGRLNTQTDKAERKYTIKTDTLYAN